MKQCGRQRLRLSSVADTQSREKGGALSREGRQTRVWRRHSLRVYKSGLDTRWPALPDQIPLTPSQQLQTWLLLSEPHQLRENVGLLETAHALVYLLSLESPCSCLRERRWCLRERRWFCLMMLFVDGDVCASDDASAASHAGSNAVQLWLCNCEVVPFEREPEYWMI